MLCCIVFCVCVCWHHLKDGKGKLGRRVVHGDKEGGRGGACVRGGFGNVFFCHISAVFSCEYISGFFGSTGEVSEGKEEEGGGRDLDEERLCVGEQEKATTSHGQPAEHDTTGRTLIPATRPHSCGGGGEEISRILPLKHQHVLPSLREVRADGKRERVCVVCVCVNVTTQQSGVCGAGRGGGSKNGEQHGASLLQLLLPPRRVGGGGG